MLHNHSNIPQNTNPSVFSSMSYFHKTISKKIQKSSKQTQKNSKNSGKISESIQKTCEQNQCRPDLQRSEEWKYEREHIGFSDRVRVELGLSGHQAKCEKSVRGDGNHLND